MIPLDASFSPPAAIISAKVQNPRRRQRTILAQGMIDTAAEITAIPETLATKLRLERVGTLPISGIEERSLEYDTYIVNLEIADTFLERRRVIGWEGEFVVIARDLLSEFTFTYDGKNRKFEIRDP